MESNSSSQRVDALISEMEKKRRDYMVRARDLKRTIAQWRRVNDQRKAAEERRAA